MPDEVLGLIYAQTVVWVGSFFCPLLPLLNTGKFLLLFYLKKVRGGEHLSGAGGIGAWACAPGEEGTEGCDSWVLGVEDAKVLDYWILREGIWRTDSWVWEEGSRVSQLLGLRDPTPGSDGGKGLGTPGS